MTTIYKKNDSLIARPEDRSFFNIQNFEVIRLNESAMDILALITEPLSLTQLREKMANDFLTASELEEFLQGCVKANLLMYEEV